jgi:hypothetical protein
MNVPVQNGLLPQGFCPSDYQTILNAFSALQYVSITPATGANGMIVSSSTPGPSDHDKPWLRLDSLGRPIRIYIFANGAWLSPHVLPPGFTMIWNQALPDFTTFDGGDANPAPFSELSGQMWQLMGTTLDGKGTQVMQAQFPVGIGQFIGTGTPAAPAGATLSIGSVGGEDLHRLVQQELAPHYHNEHIAVNMAVPNGGQIKPDGSGGFVGPIANGGTELITQVVGGDPSTITPPQTVPSLALGHNTLPPYYGVYFIQRTNRLFYVV